MNIFPIFKNILRFERFVNVKIKIKIMIFRWDLNYWVPLKNQENN